MAVEFVLHYLFALCVVALLLLGLNAAARVLARRRETSSEKKTMQIVDSIALTKQAAVHVASVEGRRYLLGTAGDCVVLLAELEVAQARDVVRGGFGEVNLRVGSE